MNGTFKRTRRAEALFTPNSPAGDDRGRSRRSCLGPAVGAVACVALAALVGRLRRRFVVVTVRGDSMEPALRHGDRVLADRADMSAVRVGDIVVLEPGRATNRSTAYWMIKRVVAVAGDRVPPGSVPARSAARDTVVPCGMLVVAGDNAAASSDSRQLGYFPIEGVLGVVRR